MLPTFIVCMLFIITTNLSLTCLWRWEFESCLLSVLFWPVERKKDSRMKKDVTMTMMRFGGAFKETVLRSESCNRKGYVMYKCNSLQHYLFPKSIYISIKIFIIEHMK